MNHIKKFSLLALALSVLCASAPLRLKAAESPPPTALKPQTSEDPYAAGQFSVSPFASYRVHEFGEFNGKLGAGLAASFSLTRNLTLEAWTLSEAYESAPVIDSLLEAGANLKFYAPLKDSGLAPYALLGYSRGLQTDSNNMETGLGLEYRFKPGLALLPSALFADAVWVQNFGLSDPVSYGQAKGRAGLVWRF